MWVAYLSFHYYLSINAVIVIAIITEFLSILFS